MTVSVDRFRLAYPEFRDTDAALIDQKIGAASVRTSAVSLGECYDQAVMLLTAHLLAMSPDGEQVRLKKENRVTNYLIELERLYRASAVGLGRIT